jgi:hypothetical protein
MAIEMLDFKSVVQHVSAHQLRVRPDCGDRSDAREGLLAFGQTRSILVTAMRFAADGPRATGISGFRAAECEGGKQA